MGRTKPQHRTKKNKNKKARTAEHVPTDVETSQGQGGKEPVALANKNELRKPIEELLHCVRGGDLRTVQDYCAVHREVIEAGEQGGEDMHWKTEVLVQAARSKKDDVVAWIVDEMFADVNGRSLSGTTALMAASGVKNDSTSTLEMLLDRKADTNVKTKNGMTALHIAVQRGDVITSKLLLAYKADATAKDENGMTALMIAAQRGSKGLVEILLEHQVQVCHQNKQDALNETDDLGRSALMIACQWNSEEVVMYLLQQGASVNQTSSTGSMPLTFAVLYSRPEIVEALVDHGAKVNAVDGWCQTALMHAAKVGRIKIVEILLKRGADVGARDRSGRTAYDIARENNHSSCAALLSCLPAVVHDINDLKGSALAETAAAPLPSAEVTKSPSFHDAKIFFEKLSRFWNKTYVGMFAKARDWCKGSASEGSTSFVSMLHISRLPTTIIELVTRMVLGEPNDGTWGRPKFSLGLRLIALAQQGKDLDLDVAMNPQVALYPIFEGFPVDPWGKVPRKRSNFEDTKLSDMSVDDVCALFQGFGGKSHHLQSLRDNNVDGPALEQASKDVFETVWNLPPIFWEKHRRLNPGTETQQHSGEAKPEESVPSVPSKRRREDRDTDDDEEEGSEDEHVDSGVDGDVVGVDGGDISDGNPAVENEEDDATDGKQ